MKHIEEAQTEGADVLRCLKCKDQLAVKGKDWPFWLHLAVREAFSELHKNCELSEAGKHTLYETIAISRDDPYKFL